jgi:hypothetical protein
VNRSAEGVAKGALNTLKTSMSGISHVVDDLSTTPVIRPVLDLDGVRRDASKVGGILDGSQVKAGVSFDRASAISADALAAREAAASTPSEEVVKEVKFEQNNYSPKAIGPGETYRNTKSQLSMAKEALGL